MNTDFTEIDITGYNSIMEQCREMTRSKVSEVLRVNAHFLNTEQGRILVEEQLYGVLLQMISYIQTNIMSVRKEKQKQGIAAAKAAGVHIGRKRKYNAEDYVDVYRRLHKGEINTQEAINSVGACKTTFFKMQKELREKQLI